VSETAATCGSGSGSAPAAAAPDAARDAAPAVDGAEPAGAAGAVGAAGPASGDADSDPEDEDEDAAGLEQRLEQQLEQGRPVAGDASAFVPYRACMLTKVLQQALAAGNAPPRPFPAGSPPSGRAGPAHMLVVIATVSPSASDTEHTSNTLLHASLMKATETDIFTESTPPFVALPRLLSLPPPAPGPDGSPPLAGNVDEHGMFIPPEKWDEAAFRSWVTVVENGRFAATESAFAGATGKQFARFPLRRVVQLCGGDGALGEALLAAFKREVSAAQSQQEQVRAARRTQKPTAGLRT
jgi:hypothetical protein